jgi:hypothetical protein
MVVEAAEDMEGVYALMVAEAMEKEAIGHGAEPAVVRMREDFTIDVTSCHAMNLANQ